MVDFDPVISVLGVTVASHKKTVFSDEDRWKVSEESRIVNVILVLVLILVLFRNNTPALSAAGLQWLDLKTVDFVWCFFGWV